MYALLKDQGVGLVLFHSSPQVPEQLFLMKVFKTHVRVYAKMDFFLFEIVLLMCLLGWRDREHEEDSRTHCLRNTTERIAKP